MGFFREIRKNVDLYLLALPGLFLIIFAYIPMSGHLLAFKKYQLTNGIGEALRVGFDNFKFFFQGHDWILVTFNTLFLNGLFIIFILVIFSWTRNPAQ